MLKEIITTKDLFDLAYIIYTSEPYFGSISLLKILNKDSDTMVPVSSLKDIDTPQNFFSKLENISVHVDYLDLHRANGTDSECAIKEMMSEDLDQIPVYIGEKSIRSVIATWRLKIGK